MTWKRKNSSERINEICSKRGNMMIKEEKNAEMLDRKIDGKTTKKLTVCAVIMVI